MVDYVTGNAAGLRLAVLGPANLIMRAFQEDPPLDPFPFYWKLAIPFKDVW